MKNLLSFIVRSSSSSSFYCSHKATSYDVIELSCPAVATFKPGYQMRQYEKHWHDNRYDTLQEYLSTLMEHQKACELHHNDEIINILIDIL